MVCTAQVMVVDGLAFPTGTRGMGNLSLTGNKQQSQHKKTRKITAPIAWDTEGLYENPTPYSAHTEKSKMPVCQQHIQHMRILGEAMCLLSPEHPSNREPVPISKGCRIRRKMENNSGYNHCLDSLHIFHTGY